MPGKVKDLKVGLHTSDWQYSSKIVSRDEWLTARKDLLEKEKAAVRANAAFNAQLRNDFPMVKIDKKYTFDGPKGKVTLEDLFEGRKQLIVYHFM